MKVAQWSVAACVSAFIVAISGLVAMAAVSYPGSTLTFLAFTAVFFLALGLIFPRPRLYGYGFFAALMFLGFWPKVILQVIWTVPFLEATGNFSGLPSEWDNALTAATFGAAGLCIARVSHLLFVRRKTTKLTRTRSTAAPEWYAMHRRAIWTITVFAIVGLNALNYEYAFYKIGVNPLLVLPLKLNVLASWLINAGFALWVVTLVWWEIKRNPDTPGAALAGPLLEAFLSSTSAMSRGIFIFHAVPYLIALAPRIADFRDRTHIRIARQIMLAFVVLLLISLSIVFWQRLPTMHGDDFLSRPRADIVSTFYRDVSVQVPQLLLKRWVGLEGVLAVESYPGLNTDLFLSVLTESPGQGIHSRFQKIAKVDFNRSDPTKTYLSNAGPIAILHMSGSLAVVTIGMFVATLLLILTEGAALYLTGNALLLSVAGAGLANVIAQTNFAYLTLAFLVELLITVTVIGLIQRGHRPGI